MDIFERYNVITDILFKIWNSRNSILGAVFGVLFCAVAVVKMSIQIALAFPTMLFVVVCCSIWVILSWLIWTRRCFLKSGVIQFVSISLISLMCIVFLVYCGDRLADFLIWVYVIGIVLYIVVLLFVCCITCIIVRTLTNKRLLITIIINDDLTPSVNMQLRKLLGKAICDIVDRSNNVDFIVLPTGVWKCLKNLKFLINSAFFESDALITMDVVQGKENAQVGFIITSFNFIVNEKRCLPEKGYALWMITGDIVKNKKWGVLDDEISMQLDLVQNLKILLLTYSSVLYILREDFDKGMALRGELYSITESVVSTEFKQHLNDFLARSYMSSAVKYEHHSHDFAHAYENMLKCVNLFPMLKHNVRYMLIMARLSYFNGDIKQSRAYTEAVRKKRGRVWGYYLNMGFYAIIEGNEKLFISHYRSLLKKSIQECSLNFAIEFLEYEKKRNKHMERQVATLIECAIVVLKSYIYSDKKRWQQKICKPFLRNIESQNMRNDFQLLFEYAERCTLKQDNK